MSDEPKTTVVNMLHEPYDVYIGRGSPFGNPYFVGASMLGTIRCRSRAEAIHCYRLWLTLDIELIRASKLLTIDIELSRVSKPTRGQIEQLRGRRLGCHCKPLPCHGDVLVALLEEGWP